MGVVIRIRRKVWALTDEYDGKHGTDTEAIQYTATFLIKQLQVAVKVLEVCEKKNLYL